MGQRIASSFFRYHNFSILYNGTFNSSNLLQATNIQTFAFPQGTPTSIPVMLSGGFVPQFKDPPPTPSPLPDLMFGIIGPTKAIWQLSRADSGAAAQKTFAGFSWPSTSIAYLELDVDPGGTKMVVRRALECALTLCIREYNTSSSGTQLLSEVLSTVYAVTENDHDFMIWPVAVNGTNYTVRLNVVPSDLGSAVSGLLNGNVTDIWGPTCTVDSEIFNVSKCVWDSETLPMSLWPLPWEESLLMSSMEMRIINQQSNFSSLMEGIADSITHLFNRLATNEIKGQALHTVPFVQISWAWISLPLLLFLSGFVTLILTIAQTRREHFVNWKTSLLPFWYRLAHDMSGESTIVPVNNVSGMEKLARITKVRLQRHSESGLWILEQPLTPPSKIMHDESRKADSRVSAAEA